jgi:large subunit ribosomal protein L47
MARIKYVLNERRLALIAAAESTRPAESIVKVHGTSPLGRADPMSLTGWEQGSQIPYSTTTLSESLQIGEEADVAGLSGGLGDGERQKMDLPESGETEDVVKGESVSQEEIEAKDEGFGGGKEAKDFVKNTQI